MALQLRSSSSARPGQRIVVVLLVIGLSAALFVLVAAARRDAQAASAFRTAVAPQTPTTDRRPVPSTPRSPTVSSLDSSTQVGPRLSGESLARAWLTAFCTRRDRDDNTWLREVSALSSPQVVAELVAQGPDAIGLTTLTSWRVERIDRVELQDRPLDTPTRQVLAYAVTVTDGVHTEQKPFVLYAYLDPDGQWRVDEVEQPYSSEG